MSKMAKGVGISRQAPTQAPTRPQWQENPNWVPWREAKWPALFWRNKRWMRLGRFENGKQEVEYATDEELARIALKEEFGG